MPINLIIMIEATECQESPPLIDGMVVDPSCEPKISKCHEVPLLTLQGMIVDFPSEPRIALGLPRVQISQFSQLFLIPYDDAESKWYTQEAMLRDRYDQRLASRCNTCNDNKRNTL